MGRSKIQVAAEQQEHNEPSTTTVAPAQLQLPAATQAHHNGIQSAFAPSGAGRTVSIDVDNFIRVRDSVYARLLTIQELIKSFSADYLRQTNLLLGEPTTIIDGVVQPNPLQLAELRLGALGQQFAAAAAPVAEEKKKRKPHDPNAPKRPLTPFFLYMQTARPILAKDMGPDAPKGAVQNEGRRRWSVMSPAEREGWDNAYKFNLRLYNARMHSYKAGNKDAKNMSAEEADELATALKLDVEHAHVDPDMEEDQEPVVDSDDPEEQLAAVSDHLESPATVNPNNLSTSAVDIDDEDNEDARSSDAEKYTTHVSKASKSHKKRKVAAGGGITSPTEKKRKRGAKVDSDAEMVLDPAPKKSARRKSGKN